MTDTANPLAIYIHWPFCKKKCPYCDFNSHVREEIDQSAWESALITELEHMAKWMPDYTPTSIFFGGGTPSLMAAKTAGAIIEKVGTLWSCADDIEITLEANPTSVEAGHFADFKSAGVNRVSLGVQSLRDEALAFLGREHTAKEAMDAVEVAAKTFDNYSFDLIYARPDQTTSEWEAELKAAIPFARGHMSLYQLAIEENTAFHHAYHKMQAFELPDELSSIELYEVTLGIMEDAAMPAYEISNFANPYKESRHNMSYWLGHPYIGVGPGAHGRVKIHDRWHATATNKSPERWLELVKQHSHALEEQCELSKCDRAQEYVMMGLRLSQGINLAHFDCGEFINREALEHLRAEKLLKSEGSQWHATRKGVLVLNEILRQLLD